MFIYSRKTADSDVAFPRHLRAAVAKLLHTEPDRIPVDRSLISLGFDSILAINLRHHIQDTMGLTISVSDLMAGRTIQDLAARLTAGDRPALTARPRPGQLPLSFAQQRLWLLDQRALGSACTVAGAVRLTGTLDREALESSLSAIVARHEALRTVFRVVDDGEPRQRVLPAGRVPLPMTDLSGIRAQRAAEQAITVARQQVERPFDLASGPLLRARLVRLSGTVHELIVTVHHIVCDGWSMAVMLDELATSYRRRISGTPYQPTPLAVQYADYTLWQREWLTGTAEHTRQLSYWRTQLDGAPPALRLPTDRSPTPGVAGGSYHQVLPTAFTDPLHTMAREADATLFMTLAAVFCGLLARLSGQSDVVFGTPIANRPDAALEPMIGLFINTIALRADLSDDPDFRTLLARVRDTTLAAYQHQDLPFEHLVESLGRADNPLFEVLFTLQHTGLPRYQLPDGDGGLLRAVPRELDIEVAKFDLTLTIQHDDDDNLRARWQYRRELFDEETIVRFAEHFQTLLERIVAEPDRPLSTLRLLTREQQHQQLHVWNASLTPGDGSLAPDLVALQAVAAPDAVALVTGDRELTYAELVAEVDALAAHLRGLGVGPDTLVGLCAVRGPDLVIGLLAILRAGGAYLPLDPTYPSARLAAILGDARPASILTQQQLVADLPAHDATVVLFSDPRSPGSAGAPAVTAANLAYVLYASSSTGTPKGVAVTHGNLTGFLAAMDARFGRGPQTWMALTSTAFDISVLELIWTFSAGHRVVLLDETSSDAASAIERHGVTHLQTTPSFASRLLADAIPALSTLDTMVLGGEAFSPTPVGQLRKLTGTTVINGYGPAEATGYAIMHPVGPDEDHIPIGRPVHGARAYLLDQHLQPVPIGVTGDLYLSGHGVARGYLNRPSLTAGRFLPNPYGLPGDRMYRTGDLARYRADGVIEFLGRADPAAAAAPMEHVRPRTGVQDGIAEDVEYKVVVNDEEQYSIWPADREHAPGWHDAGPRGPKSDCLSWIEVNWEDMRPLSLRRLVEPAER